MPRLVNNAYYWMIFHILRFSVLILLLTIFQSSVGVGVWWFMPLSTIFQLHVYCGSQFLGGGNQSTMRKPPTCRRSLTNFITSCCIEYTSPLTGFDFTTLVVIGTHCTGSCKSNYHMITTLMAPYFSFKLWTKTWEYLNFTT